MTQTATAQTYELPDDPGFFGYTVRTPDGMFSIVQPFQPGESGRVLMTESEAQAHADALAAEINGYLETMAAMAPLVEG